MARVELTVSPGTARSELVGRHGAGWRARIAAAPERGRANRALEELIAKAAGPLRAARRSRAIHGSRRTQVVLLGMEAPVLARRLEAAVRAG